MRKAVIGILGISLSILIVSTEPPIILAMLFTIILIVIMVFIGSKKPELNPTNLEVSKHGKIVGVYSANEYCIKYKYEYKNKYYKVTFAGDVELHNPHNESKEIKL